VIHPIWRWNHCYFRFFTWWDSRINRGKEFICDIILDERIFV
jgi:hypothetical protein